MRFYILIKDYGLYSSRSLFLPPRKMTQMTTVNQWIMMGVQSERESTYETLHVIPSRVTISRKAGFRNRAVAVVLIVKALIVDNAYREQPGMKADGH